MRAPGVCCVRTLQDYRYTALLAMVGSVSGACVVIELLQSRELPERVTRSSMYARAMELIASKGAAQLRHHLNHSSRIC